MVLFSPHRRLCDTHDPGVVCVWETYQGEEEVVEGLGLGLQGREDECMKSVR